MKNTLKVNHINGQIIMDRTFAKLAENTRSEEYAHLQQVRKDYPDYTVVLRQIKKNANKETYAGLTYDYMRDYIILHSATKEEELAAIAEFEELLLISRCHSKGKRFPVIRAWFFEKYPEANEFSEVALRRKIQQEKKAEKEAALNGVS